ncbi:hypothetical protein V8F06_002026 [Rhypophila decipiens]
MPLLAEIARTEGDDSPFVNYVVVPSFTGGNLTERTCPHFDEWLANVSNKCLSPGRSWIYDHGLQLEWLESWDRYCTTGDELLEQLLVLQEKLCENETIILIGHKLGCYILKKALITAWNNGHKDEYRQVLDMIETIMLIGEPSLNPKKPDEWIELISECISRKKGLPPKLATGFTVGCLQQISDKFEEILLFSTVFDVSSSKRVGLKRKFRMKKMNDGCIGCATVHVRMFTTSSEESSLESGPGDASVCPFHPKSEHFQHLLTLRPTSTANLPQVEAVGRSNTTQNATRTVVGTSDTETANDLSVQLHHPHSPVSASDIQEEGSYMAVTAQVQPSSPVTAAVEELVESLFEQQDVTSTPNLPQPDPESTKTCQKFITRPLLSSPDETQIPGPTEEVELTQRAAPQTPMIEECDEPTRPRKTYFSSFIPARDNRFYGRSEILNQLEEALLSPRMCEVPSEAAFSEPRKANLVCLVGLGGVGKTSVAKEFAYRFLHEFKFTVWLNARSDASLGKYCHDSAVALGLVNGRLSQDHAVSRNKLFTFLKNSNAPWLIVLDDCGEGVDITPYIPDDRMCSVIATARSHPLTQSIRLWSVIQIQGWTLEEGARFLINLFDAKITEQDVEAICSVAVRYHISPLSIRQLATWCTRESISFHQVAAMLGLEDMSLISRFEPPIYTLTSSRMGRLDTSASSLLARLAFYNGDRCKTRHLPSRTTRSQDTSVDIAKVLLEHGADLNAMRSLSEDSVSDALVVLYKLALVDIDESQSEPILRLHRCVQDAVRSQLDDDIWTESFHGACEGILHSWPSPRKFKNIMGGFWEDFDDLHSHVNHLAFCLVRDRLDDCVTPFDPGEEFMRLLVHHTWYNSRRGNQAEDFDLHDLAQFLITTIRKPQSGNSGRTLPRRWLQVLDDENEFTARLVDTRRLQDSPYISLSYQWGTGKHLTPSALNEYARTSRRQGQSMDLSLLPQQVSDAITFTRNMGYKYIWIDTICIDQSNPTEMRQELASLSEYYSNSAMIFSALDRGLSNSTRSSPATRFKLRWQPSQRFDISSYSILLPVKSRDSTTGGGPPLGSEWRRVFISKEQRLLPGDKSANDKFRVVDIPGIEDIMAINTADPTISAAAISATGVTDNNTSSAEARNKNKYKMSRIMKKSYGLSRHRIRNTTRKNPQQGVKSQKVRAAQLVEPNMTVFGDIISHLQAVWTKGTQTLVRLDDENPQLRSYMLAVLVVIFSICLGNCLPSFIFV